MANFAKFKESIIKNYELIVKRLTHKLKDGTIVVGNAVNAANAANAENAANAANAENAANASKLEGKTLQDIINLLKESNLNSFELLSQNLKDYDSDIVYRDSGKIDKIIYKVDNHTFEKTFKYKPNGQLDRVILISTNFEINTIVSKNIKILNYDLSGKMIGKIYTTSN